MGTSRVRVMFLFYSNIYSPGPSFSLSSGKGDFGGILGNFQADWGKYAFRHSALLLVRLESIMGWSKARWRTSPPHKTFFFKMKYI